MRPKAPRVGDKCEGQVVDNCKLMRPKATREWQTSVKDKWKTGVNCHAAARHPECEISLKHNCGTQV